MSLLVSRLPSIILQAMRSPRRLFRLEYRQSMYVQVFCFQTTDANTKFRTQSENQSTRKKDGCHPTSLLMYKLFRCPHSRRSLEQMFLSISYASCIVDGVLAYDSEIKCLFSMSSSVTKISNFILSCQMNDTLGRLAAFFLTIQFSWFVLSG